MSLKQENYKIDCIWLKKNYKIGRIILKIEINSIILFNFIIKHKKLFLTFKSLLSLIKFIINVFNFYKKRLYNMILKLEKEK